MKNFCQAIVLPLKERKARACGAPAVGEHNGDKLCDRHLRRRLVLAGAVESKR